MKKEGKMCFWCQKNEVKDFWVNYRQYCSYNCAESSVKDFKKRLGGKK